VARHVSSGGVRIRRTRRSQEEEEEDEEEGMLSILSGIGIMFGDMKIDSTITARWDECGMSVGG